MQETGELVVSKSIVVPLSVEDAFALFTERIAGWWPLATHSVAGEEAATAVVEGRVGGRLYERTRDGQEHLWGEVRVWEQPRRLVTTWHPGRGTDEATELELRFEAEGEGTRVELEHRGWERLGERAAAVRQSYDRGWDFVLGERYAGAATPTGAGT